MSKNILGKLFVAISCAFIATTSFSYGMDEKIEENWEAAKVVFGKKSRDPKTHNFVRGNREFIITIRDFYAQHGEKALVAHHPALIPFAENLLEKMNKGIENKHVQKLKKEVKRVLKDEEVSAKWVLGMHFRYMALLGEPTAAEIALFDHTPSYPGHFKALLKKDIQGEPVVLNIHKFQERLDKADYKRSFEDAHDGCPCDDGEEECIDGVSLKESRHISKELAKRLPLPIVYPLLGEGTFNPLFIVNCWMNEVYPIGMPLKNMKDVHGEQATPVSFAYHDWFHYKIDFRRRALEIYAKREIAKALENDGIWASEIVSPLVKLAAEKYDLLMEAMKYAKSKVKNDKRALAGLFFMVHEFPYFSEDFFRMSNPSKILDGMHEGSLSFFRSETSWENPADPLRTNPVDGATVSTLGEIKEAAIKRALKDETFYKPYPSSVFYKIDDKGTHYFALKEQKQLRKDWLAKNVRIEVKQSPSFIDAIATLKNGEEKTYAFPTLYRKWRNFGAFSGMLKFAGTPLTQPELTGKNMLENREIALAFIEKTNQSIREIMEDFVAKAKRSFEEGDSPYAKSFAERFVKIDKAITALSKPSKS